MKAIVVAAGGGFEFRDVEAPTPGDAEVLVRVRANALNRADLGMLAGEMYGNRGGPGTVVGMEWAGEVIAVGREVRNVVPGQRVMGSGSAAFAEQVVADWGRVSPIADDAMPYEVAATLPIALQTMHDAVVTHGQAGPGRSVLVQGASSGVGLMALQIARACGSALVVGTSTNAERRRRLVEFGAHHALDARAEDWVDQVQAVTDGRGFDVIVDLLSGPYVARNLEAAAVQARVVNVGRLAGGHGRFDFERHALQRVTYVGVTFRTRTVEEVREINRRMREDLGPHLRRGALALPIDRSFGFAEAGLAFEHMAANAHLGKIVLTHP